MNREEREQFVPELLEARYPGQARKMGEDFSGLPVSMGGPWLEELGGQQFAADDWHLLTL